MQAGAILRSEKKGDDDSSEGKGRKLPEAQQHAEREGARLFLRLGVANLEQRLRFARELGFPDVVEETAGLVYMAY